MKTILVDAMGAFVYEGMGVYEPLRELLDGYPNKKIVLTMAPDELMEKWGLNKLPYEVFTTRLDPRKTDPKYYEQVLAHFGLDAGDVVYFEHDPAAVQSAGSVGIKGYFYDGEKKDLVALKEFLDGALA